MRRFQRIGAIVENLLLRAGQYAHSMRSARVGGAPPSHPLYRKAERIFGEDLCLYLVEVMYHLNYWHDREDAKCLFNTFN